MRATRLVLMIAVVALALPAASVRAHDDRGHVLSGAGVVQGGLVPVAAVLAIVAGEDQQVGAGHYNGDNFRVTCVEIQSFGLTGHTAFVRAEGDRGGNIYFQITSSTASTGSFQTSYSGHAGGPCDVGPPLATFGLGAFAFVA